MIVLRNGSRFGLRIKDARKYSHVILRGNGKLTIAKKQPSALANLGWVEAPEFDAAAVAASLLNHAAGATDGARAALLTFTKPEETVVPIPTRYRNLTNPELIREAEHLAQELVAELIERLSDTEDENTALEKDSNEMDHKLTTAESRIEELEKENDDLTNHVESLQAEVEDLKAQINLLS